MNQAKTIVFQADASPAIGMGHLMRCIALAQAFIKNGVEVVFLVDAQTQKIAQSLPAFRFNQIEFDHQAVTNHALDYFFKLMTSHHISPELFILDGYHYSQHYREQLKSSLVQMKTDLVIIDDNGGEKAGDLIHADIIINPTCLQHEPPDYGSVAPFARVFAGEKFRLLRQEFAEQPIIEYGNRQGIVLTMGGTDPLNYSQHCLEALQNMQLEQPVTVLISNGFKHKKQLIKQIDCLPKNFSYLEQADNIAKIFAETELVISAAGGTQFELYAMQTPAILLVSFDNQWRNSQAAKQQGWAEVLDCRQQIDFAQLKKVFSLIFDTAARQTMHKKMHGGQANGAENLAQALLLLIANQANEKNLI